MSTRMTGCISWRCALAALVVCVSFVGVLLLLAVNLFVGSTSALAHSVFVPASPGGLLPGDGAIGSAALDQDNPQIAAGAGGYLVVWEDSRGNYASYPGNAVPTDGSVSGQTLKDIFAARLDVDGNLIDTFPHSGLAGLLGPDSPSRRLERPVLARRVEYSAGDKL